MCASCGCGKVHEYHDDHRNITVDDLHEAAKAAGISVEQVIQNLQKSSREGSSKK
jgi:hypothetical protein